MSNENKDIAKLKKQNKDLQMLNAELENGILHLKEALERERRKNIGDKILLEHYTRLFSASTANYLLDPNPFELSCSGSKTGTTRNYILQIKDIIAIKSEGRLKNIYLKEPIKSKEGDAPTKVLHYNNNNVGWDGLLYLIQKRGQFLFRVNKSYAINIFDYILEADNSFTLAKGFWPKINASFHHIPSDTNLNKDAYFKRLIEINFLYNTQLGFALDYEKLKEMSDYIKTLNVTNDDQTT